MIRAFLFFLVVVALSFPAFAETRVLVRGFIWGVGKDDVKKFESATFWDETPGTLRFFEGGNSDDGTDFYDVRKVISYDFDSKGALWRITYAYQDLSPPTPQIAIDLYGQEKRGLEKFYGKADSEVLEWKNKWYRAHARFWPRAFGSGDLAFVSSWAREDTDIVLRADSDGTFTRLFYVAEKRAGRPDPTQGILDLSAPKNN